MFNRVGLFNLAETRLAWLDRRQEVLSQNVANTDTPGFRARDLPDFAKVLDRRVASPPIAKTEAGHLNGTVVTGSGRAKVDRLVPETTADGNSVELDDQLTRISDTEYQHGVATNLYRKYFAMFRTALGRQS